MDVSGKRMMNLCILEVLKRYSDEENTMEQQDIIKKLQEDFGMTADRKSVKSNLVDLVDFECNIGYTERTRMKKDGTEETVMSNWYYYQDFDDSELRLLIDSVLFSKTIPTSQAQNLIDKIIGELGSKNLKNRVKHVYNLPSLEHTDNKQTMFNLELIDDAISMGKKLQFIYNTYDINKKLTPRRQKPYLVNPYQMVANNGKYYLICNYDKYDDLSNYRVDRMTQVEIVDEPVKPKSSIKGLKNGFNLPKHMAEHIYMFSDEPIDIVLKVKLANMGDMVDWFGKSFTVMEGSVGRNYPGYNPVDDEDKVYIRLSCSKQAMHHWAMQYGGVAEVVSPADLREEIRDSVEKMLESYSR